MRDDFRGVCTYIVANVNKMGRKGKELTSDQKSCLSALNDAGYRKSDIFILTGIKQSTVYSFLKRDEHRGDMENIKRTGRPKSFHDRDMRKLSRCVKKHRRKSLSEITNIFNESIDRPFSKRTVERKLHSDGFHKRSVKKKFVSVRSTRRNEWHIAGGIYIKLLMHTGVK